MRAMLLAAAVLLWAMAAAQAQVPYPPPAPWAYAPPAAPSSWSYDPYTSGMTACVQANRGNSPPCKYFMQPTYGQPNYWPYH